MTSFGPFLKIVFWFHHINVSSSFLQLNQVKGGAEFKF